MENMRENLFYEQKNGYDRIDTEQRLNIEAYCRDYMEFLNEARTEGEAVRYAVEKAEELGFRAYQPGVTLVPGDRIYRINRGKALMLAVRNRTKSAFMICPPF